MFAPVSAKVPAAAFVRSEPTLPAITPPYVRVVLAATFTVPSLAPSAMPRFALSANVVVVDNVPPFNVRCPGVGDPGAVPSAESAPIDKVPAVIVVEPV